MDPLTLIMLAVLAVLIIFMVRNSRKRKRETEELATKITEGAYVMTNFGVYGTILSIDVENNQIMLETTPGTVLKVHRQTVTRVVPTEEEVALDRAETADDETSPEFGERVHEPLLEKKPVDGGTMLNGVPLDEHGNPRQSAE
ncbi:preprotein translocase subunit YajC [Subtercola boreus]|uniref:Preprotein translocase subunit YajC n=1 Tax=Subtercola boreus TaxID=120213 RepID=A0A3E0WCK3_9MICO|nr:preprotein translocase subunit YajC [Subtercola boreus]RFA21324.1 preprotein translocase subunit YajC [Subtercola boreus]RFA21707.1 preprotein translocase subunit YajC [Subtercola boreus]RFA27676.1 preprotein translocase subunit YajC [Subtercola boreus]